MFSTFRSLLLLSSVTLSLTTRPALAQLRDAELAYPTSATTSEEEQAQLLRYFTNSLQLQPHQVLALRRALAATPETDAVTTATQLRQLLTPAQRARLEQLRPESAVAERVRLIALAH